MRRDPLNRRSLGLLAVVLLAAGGAVALAGVAGDPTDRATTLTVSSPAGKRAFEPSSVSAGRGAVIRVLFRNGSQEPHNLTFLAPLSVATATIVDPGEEQSLEFPAPPPGTYGFVCTIHPGMAGNLSVD